MENLIPYEKLKLEKILGKGQFGAVYRGVLDGLDVAVKKIPQDVAQDASSPDWDPAVYFKREVEILASVHHSNVLKFKGICFHANNLYIVTDFVDGGDLRQFLVNHSPDWLRRLTIAIEIASAISYLHGKNIVHRDVKTENVLINRDQVVKMADFGFAREVSSLKRPNHYTICGSEFFEAPEIMFCLDYDERVDIFSYGLVLCELISRKQPSTSVFKRVIPGFGIEGAEIAQRAEPGCPPELIRITQECCEDEPDKRPSLEDVVAHLKSAYEGLCGEPFIPYRDPDQIVPSDSVDTPLDGDQSMDGVVPTGHARFESNDTLRSNDSPDTSYLVPLASNDENEDSDEQGNHNVRPLLPLKRNRTTINHATKIVHEGLMTSNQPTSIHKAVTLKRNVNKTTKAVNVKQDLLDAPNAAPNVSSNSSSSLANGIRSISSTSIVDALVEANAIAGGSKPATNLPTAIEYANMTPEERIELLETIFYYVDIQIINKAADLSGSDFEKAVEHVLAFGGLLRPVTPSANDLTDNIVERKPRSVSVSLPGSKEPSAATLITASAESVKAANPNVGTPESGTTSPPTTPQIVTAESATNSPALASANLNRRPSLEVTSSSLKSKHSIKQPPVPQALPPSPTSPIVGRRKSIKQHISSATLERLHSYKRENDTTAEIIRIGRTLLVTYTLRSSYFLKSDPKVQQRWTNFLVQLTASLPVVDCQVRSKNSRLKTYRNCFTAEDLIYWLMFVEQDEIVKRPQAIELATILVKLEILVPIHGTSAMTFKEGANVLFRYRHDQAALEANLQNKANADNTLKRDVNRKTSVKRQIMPSLALLTMSPTQSSSNSIIGSKTASFLTTESSESGASSLARKASTKSKNNADSSPPEPLSATVALPPMDHLPTSSTVDHKSATLPASFSLTSAAAAAATAGPAGSTSSPKPNRKSIGLSLWEMIGFKKDKAQAAAGSAPSK